MLKEHKTPTPLVSVVIPTYRHRDFVRQCIDSVLKQTYDNVEIIVINDGSPDDTEEVLKDFIESNKIDYFYQPNQGQAFARNSGLEKARGEFIAFLDDDDLWPADRLEWQVRELVNHPDAVLVYGQNILIGAPLHHVSPDSDAPMGFVFERFISNGWIRSPGQTLIRTKAIRAIRGFDTALWGTDDWDLWLRLSHGGLFRFCPRVALYYRWHQGNASRQFYRMFRNGVRVIHKHLGLLPNRRNLNLWFASHRFVRNFASYDGMLQADQLVANGKLCAGAWLIVVAAWIWPPVIKRRTTWGVFAKILRSFWTSSH